MSRGGRGGGRGGFGGNNAPPMGLTFQDIQALNREEDALYPPMESVPTLSGYTTAEQRICEVQSAFADRLRKSAYWVVEARKPNDLEHYSDRHRPELAAQPTLKRKELHEPFFPPDVFEGYFNPKKRRRALAKRAAAKKVNIDDLASDAEGDKSEDEGSDAGSGAAEEDYDVDEEDDNDYAGNYFDNGEGDDEDGLGDGLRDEGGKRLILACVYTSANHSLLQAETTIDLLTMLPRLLQTCILAIKVSESVWHLPCILSPMYGLEPVRDALDSSTVEYQLETCTRVTPLRPPFNSTCIPRGSTKTFDVQV
ncbi:hypothetical protein PENSPDRAFT_570711 [Peniophora sp. CONT]|nr:hypothetical protein PENSPDRAFT_570711 [Peniophora sp. CONT]